MNEWIRNPALWALAMDRVARDIPKYTARFWAEVRQLYIDKGGKLTAEDFSEEM